MGQYYRPIVLKKQWKRANNPIKTYIDSWDYDNGSKLMEHSYIGNSLCKAVEHMLANEYKGYSFVWGGDYADNIKGSKNENDNTNAYFYTNGVQSTKYEYSTIIDEYYKYVLNYDKKLYVKLPHYVAGLFNIHPLPLLCSDGNGRGGGDYCGTDMDLVGSWAYNRIGVGNDVPKDFKELEVVFAENR